MVATVSPRWHSSRRKGQVVSVAGAAPKAGAQRWAAAGVLVLLIAVASFVLISTHRVAGAMEAADRTAVVSDLSQDARFYAASAYAAKVEDLYHSDENWPDVSGRNATSAAINNLTQTLQELEKTPGTDPAVIGLQTVAARFEAATTQALDLADRGQLRAAERVDRREVDPLANELTTTLTDMEETAYLSSQAHRNAAAREGRWVSGAMPFVLGGSLVVALLLALVFRRHRRAMAALACTDSLTGLPNRVGLGTGAKATVGRDAASPTAGSALLLLDLDRFKEVNDSLGHHYGDQLLVQVAQRLRQAVKGRDLVARLGGDEFAVLIADGGEPAAQLVADRIHSLLLQPFALDQLTVEVGVSIGIAVVGSDISDLAALLRCADVAMYAAKELSGGSVVYTAEQDGRVHDKVRVVSELRRALSHDELVVHYQPKIALDDGRLFGVEALIRWQHPTRGLLSPAEFLPLIEGTEVMDRLTVDVLVKALRQAKSWSEQGQHIPVAVNISARSLANPAFPTIVAGLVEAAGVHPRLLCLEITETAAIGEPERCRPVLEALGALGIRLSIDDFGTGYASMSHLKELPIDELKIDRSFITRMADDLHSAILARSIVTLGHNLGVAVVAEGVEDETVQALLRDAGCDIVQGYYYARPMPADELNAWRLAHPTPGLNPQPPVNQRSTTRRSASPSTGSTPLASTGC